ncbi:MAG TPA: cupin domain-containing protein [Acetobacteraceae bacterium]|nr:cupin domain-containing protein [Acetobacteraceae bacterium]
MLTTHDNLLAALPGGAMQEQFTAILSSPHVRIERIVSTGQSSPPGFWYDQDWDEWVLLIAGSAGLRIEQEGHTRPLRPGDHVTIPAHVRHRIDWTDCTKPTVWLAVHCLSAATQALACTYR